MDGCRPAVTPALMNRSLLWFVVRHNTPSFLFSIHTHTGYLHYWQIWIAWKYTNLLAHWCNWITIGALLQARCKNERPSMLFFEASADGNLKTLALRSHMIRSLDFRGIAYSSLLLLNMLKGRNTHLSFFMYGYLFLTIWLLGNSSFNICYCRIETNKQSNSCSAYQLLVLADQ